MTMTIQEDQLLAPPRPTAARVVVPSDEDQTIQVDEEGRRPEHPLGPADGDLLQARAFAENHPDSSTAQARLAASEFGFGNRVSASRAARSVLEDDAIDAPALMVASQVLVTLGEIGLAERALRKVLEASDIGDGARNAASVLAARIAAHQGNLEEALELLTDSGSAGSALKGSVLAQMGRCHEAIHELRSALRSVPDSPSTLCSLGYAYAMAGSPRKAIRATSAAIALAPADRTAGLNLAAFLLSQGETSDAVSAIDRLAAHHPGDIQLVLAAAAALQISGDTKGALKRLRRADTSRDMRAAPPADREELRLYIDLLKSPAMTRAEVFTRSLEALEQCDYHSMMIARILANAAQTTADLPTLEAAYSELIERYDRSALLTVEKQIAFLRFEFDRSLEAAVERVEEEPFSTDAHIAATYLMSMHKGNYQKAARIGLAGIKRGIGDDVLRNNVAFALAMGGDPDEAERVLPDLSECDLALTTAGLIKAVRGDLEGGIALYEKGEERVRGEGEDSLADIIAVGKAFAILAAGHTIPEDHLSGLDSKKSADPRFAVLCNAITREAIAGTHDSETPSAGS